MPAYSGNRSLGGSRLIQARILAILCLAILAIPAAAFSDHWTVTTSIADPSRDHPPEGLLWNCTYMGDPGGSCGGAFPIGATIEADLPVRPTYIGSSNVWAEVDGQTKTYYHGYLWSVTYPEQNTMSVGVYGLWGNIWGYVRLPDGTPLPGVIVAAYTESGQLINQATTNGEGRYEFEKPEATEIDILNHWVLPVDWWTDGQGPGTRKYRLTASEGGAEEPAELATCPWQHTVVVRSSVSVQQDFTIGDPEEDEDADEHNDECEEETPEEDPEGKCPPVPAGGGDPVHFVTGAAYLGQRDAALSGIRRTVTLTRRYNSRRAFSGKTGAFGRGWTHSYEKAITEVVPGSLLRLNKGDAAPVYFGDPDRDGVFRAALPLSEGSWIEKVGGTYVRHFRQGGTEDFDPSGRVVRQTDRVGNETLIGRDGDGKIASITAPGGRALSFGYSGSRVAQVSGPEGVIATYSYAGDFLDRVTYADGSAQVFRYDGSGQLLTRSDESGRVLERHSYSGGRALESQIGDGDEHFSFAYERSFASGYRTIVKDSNGGQTTYGIGERGWLRTVVDARTECASCPGGAVRSNWYFDSKGRVRSVSRADSSVGSSTLIDRDENGSMVGVTAPDGKRTSYTRDSMGRALTRTDPLGGTTTWTHGVAGPLSVADAVGRTTTMGYSSQGLVTSVTRPGGGQTLFGYSASGDLTSVTDPVGNTFTFERDGMGRLTASIEPGGKRTEFTYDAGGRLTSFTSPGGLRTGFERDLRGRVVKITRPGGGWTRYTYDSRGRLQAVQDAASGVVVLEYDRLSRLVSLTDPKGQVTRFEHDPLGRVVGVAHPVGGSDSYAYDGVGRLTSFTDRRGLVTSYTYDAAGRLTGRSYSDASPAESYAYDDAGRLVSAANGADTLTWAYDASGLALSETSARNGTTVSYTPTAGGLRGEVLLNGSSVASYTYDDAWRLPGISSAAGSIALGYDPGWRRSSMGLPNGVATTYGYDDALRLAEVTALLGATPVSAASYGYDGGFNRISKLVDGVQETYGYDAVDRLRTATVSGGARTDWTYDAVGNRLTQQGEGMLTRYTHDAGNRLTSAQGGGTYLLRGTTDEASQVEVGAQAARQLSGNVFEALVPVTPGVNQAAVEATDASGNVRTSVYEFEVGGTTASYTYDGAGFLTGRSEGGHNWGYEWNARGELSRVTRDGSEVARFEYDPLGRRIRKVAQGTTYSYVYDGMDILRETRTGGTTYTYIHGPEIDEPLARLDQGGQAVYYHADGLGSIVRMTNTAGQVVHEYRYDAWGNVLQGGEVGGYAFTGREWDPEIGLYYYRARYYDPKIGRFVSEDPLGLMAGPNAYSFVVNNPARWVDPLGYDYITYSPAAKVFQWHLDDGTVVVSLVDTVTGPKGNGALQEGHYKGYGLVPTTESGMVCPGETKGWKLRLDPQFDTRDAQFPNGRDRLLIHSDAGSPGTAGCVGLTCGLASDTAKSLLDLWFGATNSVIDVYVGGTPSGFALP